MALLLLPCMPTVEIQPRPPPSFFPFHSPARPPTASPSPSPVSVIRTLYAWAASQSPLALPPLPTSLPLRAFCVSESLSLPPPSSPLFAFLFIRRFTSSSRFLSAFREKPAEFTCEIIQPQNYDFPKIANTTNQ